MSGLRHGWRLFAATAAGITAIALVVAVLGPRLADRATPGPAASAPVAAVSPSSPSSSAAPSPTPGRSVAPTAMPTPDPFAGRGPAVVCDSVRAEWCDGAIALVRAAYPDEVAAALALVVDDTCPEPMLCDRIYPFDSAVILVPRSRITADAVPYYVLGYSGPEWVTRQDYPIPDHMLPLVRAVAAAPTVMVREWPAICMDVEAPVCEGVAHLAILMLARSRPSGIVAIQPRIACQAVPDYMDGSRCWQARIPVLDRTVCLVVAKHRLKDTFGQVAGDRVSGQLDSGTEERGCPPDG